MVGTVIHAALERGIRTGERGLTEDDEIEIDMLEFSVKRAREILSRAHDILVSLTEKLDIGELWLEERVWPLPNSSDCWGTSDIIGLSRDGKTLLVADLKTGKHRVRAAFNVQALIYGNGSLRALGDRAAGVESVIIAIIQPVAPGAGFERWDTDRAMLRDFAQYLSEQIALTTSGEPILVAGDHCRFCPAAKVCPLRTSLE